MDDGPVPTTRGVGTTQTGRVVLALLAVLGGWLIVIPGAVVALSLRFAEVDPVNAPLTYSLTLGAGWLVLVLALVGFGRLSDRLRQRGQSRATVLVGAIPLTVLCACGLATATSVIAAACARSCHRGSGIHGGRCGGPAVDVRRVWPPRTRWCPADVDGVCVYAGWHGQVITVRGSATSGPSR